MKRLALPVVLVFVVARLVDQLGHGTLNVNLFHDHFEVWRHADIRTLIGVNLAPLLFAIAFCGIYAHGHEGKGVVEGLRYGLWTALLVSVPPALAAFAHYRVRPRWALGELVIGVVVCLASGVVTSLAYRPKPPA